MKAYTVGQADFQGRSRVALRERKGRGETLGFVGQVTETGLWICWPLGGDALAGEYRTRGAAAQALFDELAELIPETPAATPAVLDLDTSEGMAAHLKTLPTENLRSIAAREIFVCAAGSNALLVFGAQMELLLRGEEI